MIRVRSAARTTAACLQAAVQELHARPYHLAAVIPIRQPAIAPASTQERAPPPKAVPHFGSAVRMNPVYTAGRVNACPCCNSRSWIVGRIMAECAGCGTALSIVHARDVAPVVAPTVRRAP